VSRRLLKLLNEREAHILLFVLGCILVNWPFLDVFMGKDLFSGFVNVFLLWIIIVLVLFLLSRGCNGSSNHENEQRQKERS